MHFRHALLLLIGLSLGAANVYAEPGSVVFGSWQSVIFAEEAITNIREMLGVTTHIEIAEVDGREFRRVVSPVMPEVDARRLIATAKDYGLGAWFLRDPLLLQQKGLQQKELQQKAPPSKGPISRAPIARRPAVKEADTRVPVAQAPSPQIPEPLAPASQIAEPRQGTTTMRPAGDVAGAIEIPYYEDIEINIDGRVDEAVWQNVPGYDNMTVSEPDTGATPGYATLTRFLYTEKGLYVSAVMQQPETTLVNRLSARDQYINRDAFHITIDPSGLGLYGYWFEVNLGGSVMDGQVVPERTFSAQWDGPWTGESVQTEDGWSTEMFLPWSMMAMPQGEGERSIGFWVRRKVAHLDETYSWPALPFTGPRFMSALKPMTIPGIEPKQQFAVFPYASVTQDEISGEDEYKAGFDFSYRPSSNLQISSTINPDFGAVESDDVVVNLTAFETFFPEKRLFFLEGNQTFITSPRSDINRFNSRPQGTGARPTPLTFEPEPTTLLNTRRIGGAASHIEIPDGVDVSGVELSKPTDLLGAVKVVGQNGGFRYGVLAAFEDDVKFHGTDSITGRDVNVEGDGREFGVLRALYETTNNGRKSIGYLGTLVTLPGADAMVHGIDAHSLSENGKWRYDGQYMFSDVDSIQGHGVFNDITYSSSREWMHRISVDYLDERLDVSDLGFISRNDAIVGRYGLINSRSRDLKRFRSVRNSMFFSSQWSTDGFANRMGIFSNQTLTLQNRSEVKWTVNYFPEQWDDRNSRGNGMFKIEDRWFLQVAGGTDTAKEFASSAAFTAEQESLGGWTYGAAVGFTYKPSGRFSLNFDVNYRERDGWLVYQSGTDFTTYEADDLRPTLDADFFFSARHQLRLTMQWAGIKAQDQDYFSVDPTEGPLLPRMSQPVDGSEDFTISQLTIQFRYRWEIGPLSDFFLVYTRGSNLPTQLDSEFDELFTDAFNEPIVDLIVAKIRYRFGS